MEGDLYTKNRLQKTVASFVLSRLIVGGSYLFLNVLGARFCPRSGMLVTVLLQ
jgi:hypothetical protein